MVDKKIIIGTSAGVLIFVLLLTGGLCLKAHKKHSKGQLSGQTTQQTAVQKPVKYITIDQDQYKNNSSPKADLYSDTPYDLPLMSIAEINQLSPDVKKSIDEILESSQGFYFLKQDPKTKDIIILLQNSVDIGDRYSRHNLQFAKVTPDGNVTYHFAGYDGQEGETANAVVQGDDLWEFDKSVDPPRPLTHVSYDKKGKVLFTENWNYSEDSDVKYVMKNGEGKVLSILKEVPDGDMNYRKEHIFYDDHGNTTMSVSANYEGPNLKRFTYYDSETPNESMTIESEYGEEGFKTEEKVYNQEYKLTRTLKANYSDGERKEIKVIDNEGKEVQVLKI